MFFPLSFPSYIKLLGTAWRSGGLGAWRSGGLGDESAQSRWWRDDSTETGGTSEEPIVMDESMENHSCKPDSMV